MEQNQVVRFVQQLPKNTPYQSINSVVQHASNARTKQSRQVKRTMPNETTVSKRQR